MSREIKFRAWHKNYKMIFDVLNINLEDKLLEINSEGIWIGEVEFEEVELMQFTGLNDKNGVDIYEYSELDGTYEVVFKGLKYRLRHISNNDVIDLHDYWRGKNGEIEVTREYTKV